MKPDQKPPVKRVIVDFSKLNDEILELLVSKYPYGYSSSDIIRFKNAAGEWVDCAEVRTDDTIYLVKVSKRLENAMSDYEDDDSAHEDEFDKDDFEDAEDEDEDEDEDGDYY